MIARVKNTFLSDTLTTYSYFTKGDHLGPKYEFGGKPYYFLPRKRIYFKSKEK